MLLIVERGYRPIKLFQVTVRESKLKENRVRCVRVCGGVGDEG